jgi:hypothetical protein
LVIFLDAARRGPLFGRSDNQLREPLPVFDRTQSDPPSKVVSHRHCSAEAGSGGDLVNRQRSALKKVFCSANPLVRDPISGCHARSGAEPANKCSLTHRSPPCHFIDRNRLMKMPQRALENDGERPALASIDGGVEKLRLASISMGRNDEPPCHLIGDFSPKIAPDQMQAEIQTRRASRGRENLTLVDIEHLWVHPYLRVTPL